jgi:hypothetical protein
MARSGQSASSIHQAAIIVSGAYQWARHNHHLPYNPALGARLPHGATLTASRKR